MLPAKKERESPPLEQKSKALLVQKGSKMPVLSRETENDPVPSIDHTEIPNGFQTAGHEGDH
jgi:hypothetical protein